MPAKYAMSSGRPDTLLTDISFTTPLKNHELIG